MPGRSAELAAFLTTGSLDDLLVAAQALPTPLSATDGEVVTAVIKAWRDEQAVANLLFHPTLIPDAQRLPALQRALSFDAFPYYTLAAVVGLQSIDPTTVEGFDPVVLASMLIAVIERRTDVVAARASVSLWTHVAAWAPQVGRLVSQIKHPNSTVAGNLMAWFATQASDQDLHQIEWGAEDGELKSRLAEVRAARRLQAENPKASPFRFAPLLAYIPNLDEVRDAMMDEEPDWQKFVERALLRTMKRMSASLVTRAPTRWFLKVERDQRVFAPAELGYGVTLDVANLILTVTHGNSDAGPAKDWQHATAVSLHGFRRHRKPIEVELQRIFATHPPNQFGFS